MTDGEFFWNCWALALAKHVGAIGVLQPWQFVSTPERDALEAAVSDFLILKKPIAVTISGIAGDFKTELQKYGRHLPSCSTAGPCTCGFDAVEQQLRMNPASPVV